MQRILYIYISSSSQVISLLNDRIGGKRLGTAGLWVVVHNDEFKPNVEVLKAASILFHCKYNSANTLSFHMIIKSIKNSANQQQCKQYACW